MTSGNVSDEPIAKDNDEALDAARGHRRRLPAPRPRHLRALRQLGGARRRRRASTWCGARAATARCRSRWRTDAAPPPVLALGAHLKNTFCILRDGRAFVGPHIGDLDHPLSLRHHEEALATYLRLFRAEPGAVAADLHPDYASTHLAERWWDARREPVRVQHHHAHIASVMAEHAPARPGHRRGLRRHRLRRGRHHLGRRVPALRRDRLPSASVTSPRWCSPAAIAARARAGGWRSRTSSPPALAETSSRRGFRAAPAPPTSGGGAWSAAWPPAVSRRRRSSTSAGRLFDAVASLLGVAHVSSFEASAAMRLEALARTVPAARVAPIAVRARGHAAGARHPCLVAALRRAAPRGPRRRRARRRVPREPGRGGGGGVRANSREATGRRRGWRSAAACSRTRCCWRAPPRCCGSRSLAVYTNHAVPANDGGVSLGQAFVAAVARRPAARGGGHDDGDETAHARRPTPTSPSSRAGSPRAAPPARRTSPPWRSELARPARRRWPTASSPAPPCWCSVRARAPPTPSTTPSSTCTPCCPAAARCPRCR